MKILPIPEDTKANLLGIAADRRLTHHRDLPTGSPQSQSLWRFTLGSPSTGRQLEDVEWLQS